MLFVTAVLAWLSADVARYVFPPLYWRHCADFLASAGVDQVDRSLNGGRFVLLSPFLLFFSVHLCPRPTPMAVRVFLPSLLSDSKSSFPSTPSRLIGYSGSLSRSPLHPFLSSPYVIIQFDNPRLGLGTFGIVGHRAQLPPALRCTR